MNKLSIYLLLGYKFIYIIIICCLINQKNNNIIKYYKSITQKTENQYNILNIKNKEKLINIMFDKIYVINLLKDKNKKDIFIRNNSHTSIDFTFFQGVDAINDEESKIIFNNYINKPICYDGCSKLEKKYKKKNTKIFFFISLIDIYSYNLVLTLFFDHLFLI